MSSIPVAGLAKALIVVTVSLHPGAAHHDPGQLHRPARRQPVRDRGPRLRERKGLTPPWRHLLALGSHQRGSSFRTDRDRAIAGLMLLSGLRSAEVLGLRVADVDIGRGWVRVTGKGDQGTAGPAGP